MMKFKKPYAFLVAGLLCATVGAATIGLNSNVKPNVEPAQALVGYDWDFTTKASSNSNYTNTWEYGNVVSVFGAANNNAQWGYIRVGGKSKSNATSTLTSINASPADISSVDLIALNTSSGSGYTLHNITLEVATDNSFTTIVDTITKSEGSISTDMNFAPSSGDCWASGSYFKMSFNWSCTTSSNRGMDVEKVVFNEKVSATDVLTGISYEGTPVIQYSNRAFDPDGLTFYGTYSESGEREIDVSDITFTPETLTADTTEVVATYEDFTTTISGFDVVELSGIIDKLTAAAYSNTKYADFVTTDDFPSGAVYAGHATKNNGNIQINTSGSNKGIYSINSGGIISAIEVSFASNTSDGRTLNIFASNTAYTASTDLVGSNDYVGQIKKGESTVFSFSALSEQYKYVGLSSDDGAIYIESIKFYWQKPAVDPVEEFANKIINDLTCINNPEDRGEDYLTNLSNQWLALKDEFELLDEDTKLVFTNGTSDNEIVKAALAKYDLIVKNYGSDDVSFPNFMNREVVSAANNITNPILNTTNNIIIIVSVCALAITAIGVFVIISKKRKEIKK